MAHSSCWFSVLIALACARSVMAAEAINGLNAEFFGDKTLSKSLVKRIDPNVDWHWGRAHPHPDVPADHFSVRWSGWIKAPRPGRYKLILMGDDGLRLHLDGNLQIDAWKGGHNHKSVFVDLTGQPQQIVVEYFEIDLGSWIALWWQPPGAQKPWIIPTDVLFPDEQSAKSRTRPRKPLQQGLIADYFDRQFNRHQGRGLVHRTEAIWGDWHPDPNAPADGGARYSGFLVPEKSGRYKLVSFADDKVRVWMDEKPVLEGNSTAYVELEADTPYAIIVEYVDSGRWGSYYLHWIPPETTQEVPIPCELLYPTRQSLPKGNSSKK